MWKGGTGRAFVLTSATEVTGDECPMFKVNSGFQVFVCCSHTSITRKEYEQWQQFESIQRLPQILASVGKILILHERVKKQP